MNGSSAIPPHGGVLVDRVLRGSRRQEALARLPGLRRVAVPPTAVSDLEMIGVGALSPLTSFIGKADYERVLEDMRLADGTAWSLPITLPVARDFAASIHAEEELLLVEPNGQPLALMVVSETFDYDKQREARLVYGTTDEAHPGVARVFAQGDVLLGGEIWLLNKASDQSFARYRFTPAETRRLFSERGWRRIVGFQTRNPIHRAHEYLQKAALETVDGLFLNPLVGETKGDDVPADIRMRSYLRLLEAYYPADRIVLGVFPAAMRYAGPREAIFHAICRKNYGCTHFIVGRDHAGVGSYYGTYDAQRIFDQFRSDELGIVPLFFEHTFFCRRCGSMASYKTCPHDSSAHLMFSGTQVREMLRAGQAPPTEYTRPEVAEILMEGMRPTEHVTSNEEQVPTPGLGAPRLNGRNGKAPKLLVLGLDCLPPEYVFQKWRDQLPNLRGLMDRGLWGELQSTVPPITVPAWSSMLSGKDPGTLGVYGFRNRADHSYDKLVTANSRSITEDRVWDVLSRAGKQVAMIGVPQTYPVKPINGVMVGCFLTPTTQSNYTHPLQLKDEITRVVGDYVLDVHDFRTDDKQRILDQIQDMTEKRFKLARHLIKTREWDFFMLHEIGPDRIHHSFWKHMDPEHPKHEPGNPYQDAIREYYVRLDGEIGRLLALVPDHTSVLVASDHGAKRMDGGICLNEWLMREGYLSLASQPPGVVPIERCEIDWPRTMAWGSGGYYGRLFLNVKGREPDGLIEPGDYERVRDEIAAKVAAICDPAGKNLGSRAYKPEEVYAQVKGVPPDLIIYFGDLYWRAVGSVGYDGAIHTFENDTGPDDANHSQQGIFIMTPSPNGKRGQAVGLNLMDVAPTILSHFDLPIPADMQGRLIG